MSNRFSWETDDDRGWDKAGAPVRRRSRRVLRTLVWVSIVGLGLLVGIVRLGQWRLALREEVVGVDIAAAHATWRQAVARGDLELMTTVTVGEVGDWYTDQRRLLLAGQLLGRQAMGLELNNVPDRRPHIELSPDMSAAEIRFQQSYLPLNGSGTTPLWLEHTAFYVRHGVRWAQRAPTDEDWGTRQQITTARTIATFPERDRLWVEQLIADLDRDLGSLCDQVEQNTVQAASSLCDPQGRIRIEFVTDSGSLLTLSAVNRPAMSGLSFELPAPTLVGLPKDEATYAVLYRGYADRVLSTLRQIAALPLELPAQDLAALCSTTAGSRLELVTYMPAEDRWTDDAGSQPYRFLRPTPDDSGFILRAGFPGIDLDRLQLMLGRDGEKHELIDVGYSQLTASLASFAHTSAGAGFTVRFGQGSTGVANYAWYPLEPCASGQCPPLLLDGFTDWSPDHRTTLISDVGELVVGDYRAIPSYSLGPGFSPFWLSPTTFGYVELSTAGVGPDMRIVLRNTTDDTRTIVADSEQLMAIVDPERKGRLRIRYVTASPADPSLILVGGSPAASDSREFVIIGIRMAEDAADGSDAQPNGLTAEVLLRLPNAPMGDPATYTPTGSPPFTVSADGRWLVAVRFADPYTNTWELNLVNLASKAVKVITTNYPAYPAQHPFFDWSADGQWLGLVDDGYLRLIAPDHDYERVVPHEFRNCSYTGWVSR